MVSERSSRVGVCEWSLLGLVRIVNGVLAVNDGHCRRTVVAVRTVVCAGTVVGVRAVVRVQAGATQDHSSI